MGSKVDDVGEEVSIVPDGAHDVEPLTVYVECDEWAWPDWTVRVVVEALEEPSILAATTETEGLSRIVPAGEFEAGAGWAGAGAGPVGGLQGLFIFSFLSSPVAYQREGKREKDEMEGGMGGGGRGKGRKKDLVGVGPKGRRRMGGVEYLGVGDLKDLGIIFCVERVSGICGLIFASKGGLTGLQD